MILVLMGYYRHFSVHAHPLALTSSTFLTTVTFSGDLYLPHTKAHRVMLCPDGPDTGFVVSNYPSSIIIIDQKRSFIKILSSPKHPPGKSPSILEPYFIVRIVFSLC